MRSPAAVFGALWFLLCGLPGWAGAQDSPIIPGLEPIPGYTPPVKTGKEKDDADFIAWFQEACDRATDEDIGWLGDVLLAAPLPRLETQPCFHQLAGLWIRRELAAIHEEKPAPLRFSPDPGARLPAEQPLLSASLTLKWRYTQAAVAPFNRFSAALPPAVGWRGFPDRDEALIDCRRRALLGQTEHLASDLSRLTWVGGRLSSDDLSYDETLTLMLMALLRERRLPEAVGATLIFAKSAFQQNRPFPHSRAWIAVLNELGVPWEDLALGAIAAPISFEWGRPVRKFNRSEQPTDSAQLQRALIRLGSAESLQLLAERIWAEPAPERGWFFNPAEEAIEPGPFALPKPEGAPRPERFAPEEIQLLLLGAMHDCFQTNMQESRVLPIIDRLRRIGRIESREALRPLLDHWSSTVALAAARALASLGEALPTLPPRPPVVFAFALADQPLASTDVSYSVDNGCHQGGTRTTDERGLLRLPRDLFLNPASKGIPVVFSSPRSYRPAAFPQPEAPPLWKLNVPQPADLDQVIPVAVSAGRLILEITLPSSIRRTEDDHLNFDLALLDSANASTVDWNESTAVVLPIKSRIEFPSLEPGPYRLRVRACGAQEWISPTFSISPGVNQLRVPLVPGSDVRLPVFRVETPLGLRWPEPECELWSGGKKLASRVIDQSFLESYRRYRGLPPGRYRLRVISRKETLEAIQAANPGAQVDDEYDPDWAGMEIPFEITAASGPELVLPPVELPLVNK